jgi:tRNA ligase
MIADRNNHQRRERKQLIDDISKIVPTARFVALHYVHEQHNYDNIRQATRSRIMARGDNHQTIHASTKGNEIIEIMEGFMYRFEHMRPDQAPDDGFDTIIDLDVLASSRENLEAVITRLYNEYPKLFRDREMPTSDDMDAAIAAALNNYTVDIKHEIKGGSASNWGKKTQPNGSQAQGAQGRVLRRPAARDSCLRRPRSRLPRRNPRAGGHVQFAESLRPRAARIPRHARPPRQLRPTS